MNINSLLVVAAHPDDEILGCGGTVSRLSAEGVVCHCAILSEGITSRYGKAEHVPQKELDELAAHTDKASEIVGYSSLHRYQFPDNQFDTVPLLEITKIIEALVADLNPDTIMTHHAGDLNRDHQLTHRAVLTATRPIVESPVKNLLTFEIPSSTEWSFSQFEEFRPSLFFDIDRTLDDKVQAMAIYEGESRAYPHPRSSGGLKALARSRGVAVGMGAAEAFEVVRSLI